jgi:hypothetical protein
MRLFAFAALWYGAFLLQACPALGVENAMAHGAVAFPDGSSRQVLDIRSSGNSAPVVLVSAEGSSEAKARAFAYAYHQAWSSDNAAALAYMRRTYAPIVRYYGKNRRAADVLAEKIRFAERWPIRYYAIRNGSMAAQCSGTLCEVQAVVEWYASSGARRRTSLGVARFDLEVDVATGLISGESGSVIHGAALDAASIASAWRLDDGICRGQSGDQLGATEACRRREVARTELTVLGWCYGHRGEDAGQMRWHACDANSIR